MFGHAADPNTKNYRYGARKPTEGLEQVWAQAKLAHNYYNKLVEIELGRRQHFNEMLSRLAPDVAQGEKELAEAEKGLQEALQAAKNTNKAARGRAASREQKEMIQIAKGAKKLAAQRLREAKVAAKGRSDIVDAAKVIDEEAKEALKNSRRESGLYWGTYLQVEQSMPRTGVPPVFHRWTGDFKIAVQIQKGLPITKALEGKDNRLRVHMRTDRYADVWMRIGSQNDRSPQWAVVPVFLHRPLPAGSCIKWAYLLGRRVGTKTKWSVVFVLAGVPEIRSFAKNGEVAVDLNWRIDNEDSLRVACWFGDDGAMGQVVIPKEDRERWEKTEDLRSIRDKNFTEARDRLCAWLRSQRALPEWIAERTSTLYAWRSQARLAKVIIDWRTSRFPGDEDGFQAAEAWRAQDKHLLEWEANNRRKAISWRTDLYRRTATALAQRYRLCVVETTQWNVHARRPDAGEDPGMPQAARRNRMIAAVGDLRRILCERFKESEKTDASLTTQTCSFCGHIHDVPCDQVLVKCPKCGSEEDRDLRAAKNTLRAAQCRRRKPERSNEAA